MRILLALALLLLAGCPSKQTLKGQPDAPKKSPSLAMKALQTKLSRPYPLKQIPFEEFPPVAAAYLDASLNDLMSGGVYAPKDMTLSYMRMLPGCQIGRDAILREVEISGEAIAPALIAAYMAADPEGCLTFVQRQVNAGQIDYLSSIGPDKEVGKWVLEHVYLSEDLEGIGAFLLDGIMEWELDPTPYLPSLHATINSRDQVGKIRVAGYLLSKDLATLEEKQVIIDSLKSDEMMDFTAGIEAIKLVKDPDFANELVSIVAETDIGEIVEGIEPDMKVAFTAYGLTSLGGEQAKILRMRLLESTSSLIRMEAALGELMQGDPSHWNKLIEKGDFTDDEVASSLQPADVLHVDLLPFLLEFANSKETYNRLLVAQIMSRYKEYSDHKTVQEIIAILIEDPEAIIRERAWFISMSYPEKNFLDRALKVLQDEDEHPKIKLVAAIYAMRPTIDKLNGRN